MTMAPGVAQETGPLAGEGDASGLAAKIRQRVAETVVGQDTVVERLLIALLTGGHILLEGVPGIGKTLLAQALAKAINLQFGRVQFTIDMLPADILGSEILDQAAGSFKIHKGPVFTNLLLADEINRATPKVQSALLEAMQERKVTIGDTRYVLDAPFLVMATQNPIEQSGTFELPEAQLDRFMMCHRLTYPTPDEEEAILTQQLGMGLRRDKGRGAVQESAFDTIRDEPCCTVDDITEAMEQVQKVHVSDVFVRQCVDLVTRTREHPDLEVGCSPRAGLALTLASRARAHIFGRDHVLPEDLFALAEDVVLHRIRMTYEALADGRRLSETLRDVLSDIS